MAYCDLHMHSTASDGTDRPEDLPLLAQHAGLQAIALTDHDTTAGVQACQAAADKLGLAFVPGIELSADAYRLFKHVPEPEPPDASVHILGYFVQHDAPTLLQTQQKLQRARQERNPQIVERLRELGVAISNDEVAELAGDAVVGRPHIAQVLMQKAYVKSMHEAFVRYLGPGAAAYVPKQRLTAEQAIATIHDAGGLAMLAHPVQLHTRHAQTLEHILARLRDEGLDGVETQHPDHRPADIERYTRLARQLSLLTCGGSDYHGSRKNVRLGQAAVAMQQYDQLAEAHAARTAPRM